MAGGLNKKFLDDPVGFIKGGVIEVNVMVSKLQEVADKHVDPQRAVIAQRGRLASRDVDPNLVGTVSSGIFLFDLVKSPKTARIRSKTLGISHMSSIPVYELKEWGTKQRDQVIVPKLGGTSFDVQYRNPGRANPIEAYWVPWNSGSCWSVQLGADANFFFTPTMDGCSLAISSGANPVVTHGNYKDPMNPTVADEAVTLQEIGTHHATTLGTDVNRTLKKTDYAATHHEKTQGINKLVTVIGIRSGGAWTFYWQRRQVDANNANAHIILQNRMVVL